MEWDREDWKFMAVAARCLCFAPRRITSSAAVALVTDTCSNIASVHGSQGAAWLTASPSPGLFSHWPPAKCWLLVLASDMLEQLPGLRPEARPVCCRQQ